MITRDNIKFNFEEVPKFRLSGELRINMFAQIDEKLYFSKSKRLALDLAKRVVTSNIQTILYDDAYVELITLQDLIYNITPAEYSEEIATHFDSIFNKLSIK